MTTYEFDNKADLVRELRRRQNDARARAANVKTQRDRTLEQREASVWGSVADMMENSFIIDASGFDLSNK